MGLQRLREYMQVRPSEEPFRRRILLVLSVLILSAGIWIARESGQRTDLRMRRELARQARSIAATILPSDVRALSFTAKDADRPEFLRLSAQLRAYAKATGLRSLYTMALRNGQLVFGPENLKPDDPYASPPGTVYQEPSEKDFEVFQTGEAIIQGPVSDEYGLFVSASVPVIDPLTGEVLLVVGLDIDAPVWQGEIRKAQWIPFLIALVPLGILLVGYFVLKIRQFLSPVQHERLRHAEAATCALIMLLLTLTSALLFDSAERKTREDTFRTIAQAKAANYTDLFKDIRSDLDMLVRFFESSEQINHEEFRSYCKSLLETSPSQTCMWLPSVSAAEAEIFAEKVRMEDLPDFPIWQSGEQNLPVPAPGEILYPALYVEPLSGHEKELGCDLYSNPLCREAIDEAVRTGQATSTGLITPEDPDNPSGIFIFKRVDAQQQKGMAGFFIYPKTLFEKQMAYTASEMSHVSVSLFQLSTDEPPRWMACSMEKCRQDCWQTLQTGMHITVPVFAFGKAYGLLIAAEPQWLEAHPLRNGRIALIVGLVLTVLLTTLIATLANRPALLENLVQQRTKELYESEERFELATSAANIGVWDLDIANNRLIWDSRMHQLYGVKPGEFSGTYEAWNRLIHPDDSQAISEEVTAAEQGRKEFDTEFRIILPGGEIRYIKAFGKVIRATDRTPLRMIGVNYDITARERAEQRIKSQLDELNRWHRAMLGRETRVLELKKEINEILRRIGEPPRYEETASEPAQGT